MALPRRLSNVDELPPGLELRERHLLELALLAPRLAPALSLLAAFVSDETVGDVNKLEVQVGDEAVEALRRALGNRDINVDEACASGRTSPPQPAWTPNTSSLLPTGDGSESMVAVSGSAQACKGQGSRSEVERIEVVVGSASLKRRRRVRRAYRARKVSAMSRTRTRAT